LPLRRRLAEREAARRLADWLGRRAQLGRHVFARGAPDPALDAAPAAGDLAELLRACLRLLEPSVRDRVCRPRPPPLWRAPDALARMRALLPALPPGGAPLGRFLPAAAEAGDAPLQRRAALAGTLAAGLKLAREGALALEQAGGFGKVRVRPPPPPPEAAVAAVAEAP
jgi:segregation and condensation protein A